MEKRAVNQIAEDTGLSPDEIALTADKLSAQGLKTLLSVAKGLLTQFPKKDKAPKR
jgi:DNA-binding phage protein